MPERGPGKKLREAAAHWAHELKRGPGRRAGVPLAQQLRAAGAPPEIIQAAEARGADADETLLPVLEGLEQPVLLFMASATQWRRAGISGAMTGLDYAAVKAAAEWLGIAATPALLVDLRTMESAALAELAKGQERRGAAWPAR